MSSTAAVADIIAALLLSSHQLLPTPFADEALEKWSEGHNLAPPTGTGAARERTWEKSKLESLLYYKRLAEWCKKRKSEHDFWQ